MSAQRAGNLKQGKRHTNIAICLALFIGIWKRMLRDKMDLCLKRINWLINSAHWESTETRRLCSMMIATTERHRKVGLCYIIWGMKPLMCLMVGLERG